MTDQLRPKPVNAKTGKPRTGDELARFGYISGHIIEEFATAMYRSAFCSCGWNGKVERRGNAWAQTSKLRKLEREHIGDRRP